MGRKDIWMPHSFDRSKSSGTYANMVEPLRGGSFCPLQRGCPLSERNWWKGKAGASESVLYTEVSFIGYSSYLLAVCCRCGFAQRSRNQCSVYFKRC